MLSFKRVLMSVAIAGFLALPSAVSAMPVGQLGADARGVAGENGVQQVRWVCGPRGCVWRPGYRPYRYYRHRPYRYYRYRPYRHYGYRPYRYYRRW